eukprot:1234829-Prymnesium_polylepis.1
MHCNLHQLKKRSRRPERRRRGILRTSVSEGGRAPGSPARRVLGRPLPSRGARPEAASRPAGKRSRAATASGQSEPRGGSWGCHGIAPPASVCQALSGLGRTSGAACSERRGPARARLSRGHSPAGPGGRARRVSGAGRTPPAARGRRPP